MTLEEIRTHIDAIDDELLRLFNARMEWVQKVGELKHRTGGAIYRPERERQILTRLNEQNRGPLSNEGIEAIFLEIFAVARFLEHPEKVAYLGPQGSFTHQAAEGRFGALCDYLPSSSIAAVFKAVQNKQARYGVVPIENNSEGSVGETLDLLAVSGLKIVAETSLSIHHAFASTCENLEEITTIYSKDIAFGQCRQFLQEHGLDNISLVPVESTAKAAKMALQDSHSAAICPAVAARLYHLPLMFENIEDNHNNQTRFVVVSDFKTLSGGNDKTSIVARLDHANHPGALSRFLLEFENAEINLTKIESRPMKEAGFSYTFFIDFEGHIDDEKIQQVLSKHNNDVVWLGSYAKSF